MLASGHNTIGATEVDADEPLLDASDSTDNDGADLIFKGREDGIAFGFAKSLNDDLLSGLSGDAAETLDGVFFFNLVADFGLLVFDLIERDFGRRVVGDAFLDDFASHEDIGFAGLGVEGGADVHVAVAVVFAPSGGDGLFDDV